MLWSALKQVQSPDEQTRITAVQKLSSYDDERAKQAVINALDDKMLAVSTAAAKGLEARRWQPYDQRRLALYLYRL